MVRELAARPATKEAIARTAVTRLTRSPARLRASRRSVYTELDDSQFTSGEVEYGVEGSFDGGVTWQHLSSTITGPGKARDGGPPFERAEWNPPLPPCHLRAFVRPVRGTPTVGLRTDFA